MIEKYLDDAAAKLPAPGGGSIAAMIGALGASMASMTAKFTLGKKKYAAVEDEVRGLLAEVESQREKLTALVDADVSVYSKVSAAYGMPKESDDEKSTRSAAIKEACKAAMAVPLDIARACAEVAGVCRRLVEVGNRNLITDVGVSVLAADAACRAAALNVQINLGSIGDDALAAKSKAEIDALIAKTAAASETVMGKVKAHLER